MTPFEWATHVDHHTQKYIDMVARQAERLGWWAGFFWGTLAACVLGTVAILLA